MQSIQGYYIAPGAIVAGDVVLGAGSNIWFGCVLRGDLARITIGQRVNVQVERTDRGAWIDSAEVLDGGTVYQLAQPRRGGICRRWPTSRTNSRARRSS